MKLVVLLFLTASQQDVEEQVRSLIEGLRSEQIEEREKAILALRKLGKAAIPALKKAAKDPYPEVKSDRQMEPCLTGVGRNHQNRLLGRKATRRWKLVSNL